MSRSPNRPATLRSLVEREVLPTDSEIDRTGVASWHGTDFYHVLSLDVRGGTWALWVGDRRFQALDTAGYGGVKGKLQPVVAGQAGRALTLEVLAAELVDGIAFVRDREDLCEILTSPESVVRRSVEAWQMIANFPARLAQALLVSRDLGREDLGGRIRNALDNAPPTNAFGKQITATESARRWLKEYKKVIESDVNL